MEQSLRQIGGSNKSLNEQSIKNMLLVLFPLLIGIGSDNSLENNLNNIVQWLVGQSNDLKSSIFPALLLIGTYFLSFTF